MSIYHYFDHFYCSYVETAISDLPVTILTSLLDLATYFLKESNNTAIRLRFYTFFCTVQIENLPYISIPVCLSLVALRTGLTFTQFELGQPIHS